MGENHGWTHAGEKPIDPIPGLTFGGGEDAYHSPVIFPILLGEQGFCEEQSSTAWVVAIDTAVRNNAVFTNAGLGGPGAQNDYFTKTCVLGPKGSIWALLMSHKYRTDGGIITFSLASVESPNPNRAGVSDEGTLTDNALTYVTLGTFDTYSGAPADGSPNAYPVVFRIMGEPGDPLTAVSVGADPYTGYDTIDGGPGVYKLKLAMATKNAASSGYRLDLTGLALARVDDLGRH